MFTGKKKSHLGGSNTRPSLYERDALPTVLKWLLKNDYLFYITLL